LRLRLRLRLFGLMRLFGLILLRLRCPPRVLQSGG
jgi:hypothetical protein